MINFSFLKFVALMSSYEEKDACKWILEKMELTGYQVIAGKNILFFLFAILVQHLMIQESQYAYLCQSGIYVTPTFIYFQWNFYPIVIYY